jgi:hypothetical protein
MKNTILVLKNTQNALQNAAQAILKTYGNQKLFKAAELNGAAATIQTWIRELEAHEWE